MTTKKQNWIIKQKKDVEKLFKPKVHYNKEFDILYITWLPNLKCKFSLETENDFVFDIDEDNSVKGIEIMDFAKRFLK